MDVNPATLSGLPLKPVYKPGDTRPAALAAEALPGRPPFTRGIHETMYRTRLWTVRQYAGFASPRETNARWQRLLESGATGLSTAFDLPTQLGLDPDDPRAHGEVGRVGVSIASVDDMKLLFDGIDLSLASVSMTINAPASVLVAFLQIAAEELGFDPKILRGTVQNDILKEFAARNNFIFPPAPSMDLTVDVIEHCLRTSPEFYPISVSGYHLREAGCTAPQEIAFTLANALEYLRAAIARGVNAIDVGRRLSFFFAAATDVLEEAAKFRAARRLWSSLMLGRFNVSDEKARALRFHCQTAGSLLTSQEPENNLARIALQALAAILGGCQSLHTNAYDEALGLPGERSAQLAAATQLILAYEAGVANTADPLGGAYAIEALTDKLEADARTILAEIDALGGAAHAVEGGFYQRRIAESAFRYQRDVESGARKVVSVNCYQTPAHATSLVAQPSAPHEFVEQASSLHEIGTPESSIQTLRPEIETEARDSVARTRSTRNADAANAALAELESAARRRENRMPAILAAARARCTTGELCEALKRVYGEQR
ncbi:MAG TPA: methylmalonyl-CoA mutase family protein [Planctomycetota bacterium]|nr:methylmalonyl-CoA mutase family protein [Planctomycetota bacterium]